jgi:GT2 family glycosyltransferase
MMEPRRGEYKHPMSADIRYWLQGERVQNFGDYLSEYLHQNLFLPQPAEGRELRIIGSCIDDDFIDAPAGTSDKAGSIFWGCGLRKENGLSLDRLGAAEFLAVRGPLSRSALRLGDNVPIGDPALLLPALHRAGSLWRNTGSSLVIPHFHDRREDAELLRLTGCSAVLRPNIANDLTAVREFIDQIIAAKFVLCGSLHAAIVAAAYGKPFAFWDSGSIDLPFKWFDFAASLAIPCVFQPNLAEGEAHFHAEIAPVMRIPILWPLLVAAPLPVRPDAFVHVVEMDVARHGLSAFEIGVSSRAADRLRDRLRSIGAAAEEAVSLRNEVIRLTAMEQLLQGRLDGLMAEQAVLLEQTATQEAALERQAARLREGKARDAEQQVKLEEFEARDAKRQVELQEFEARDAKRQVKLEEFEARDAKRQVKLQEFEARDAEQQAQLQDLRDRSGRLGQLERELETLRPRLAQLAAEEARLHEAVQARDQALMAAQQDAAYHALQLSQARRSITWRLTKPLRAAGRSLGWARRAAAAGMHRLRGLPILRSAQHWRGRGARRREAILIRGSALFDPNFYRTQTQAGLDITDPVIHYQTIGAAQGCDPNSMFDSRWYAATYMSGAPGRSPLGHYLTSGAAAGCDPHPLFETDWYIGQHPGVTRETALLHYLRPAADSAAPNRLFDPAGYLCEYPDARASGLGAVQHFIRHGAARHYQPHALFDTAWYLATYPDAGAGGVDALAHYLRIGAAKNYQHSGLQRRIPGFEFDRLAFPAPEKPEASIIIPAYGHYFDTLRCLYSIAAHTGDWFDYEVIVLDDNPANPLGPLLAGVPGLRVHSNVKNLGFLRSCNQATTLARGAHLVFLNNDTLVSRNWLDPMLELVRHDPNTAMVGCKLLNEDATIQEAGGVMLSDGWGHPFGRGDDAERPEYNYRREVDIVIGAAFLVRGNVFAAVGGFDDRYAPAFFEEFDLAFEVRRLGLKVMYQPHSAVTHLGSTSYGAEARDRQSLINHDKFCMKWAAALATQPPAAGDGFQTRQRPGAIGVILVIDDKVPEYDRHAGALTIFQYLKLLVNLGFRVVYCPADLTIRQPYTGVLQALGIEVLHAPASLSGWLDQYGRHLLAVWTARPYVSAGLIDLIRTRTDAKILYYPHDLHYLRNLRNYRLSGDLWSLEESNRVRRLEHAIFKAVDCVMTPSAVEAEIIRQDVPDAKVTVIPPYLYPSHRTTRFSEAEFSGRSDIIFIGGYKHPPNVDASTWLAGEIMPLVWQEIPTARLLLIGDDPTEEVKSLAGPRVEVTGYVPDLAPYFARARVSVSPLRVGAGVKGKIVSSLEAGIPVVTTDVGNEGIALADGKDVLLGETAPELAAAIVRLLRDAALCAQISAAGADVIRHRFSEDGARDILLEILDVDLCPVCGKWTQGASAAGQHNDNAAGQHSDNWSERFVCENCFALSRTAMLADVIIAPFRDKAVNSLARAVPFLSPLRIHELSFTGPIGEQLQQCNLFTQSEFFDGVPSGEIGPSGIICQDLQNMTFRDCEIDLLISQDVLERVPDQAKAVAEIHRVLKPGGQHIFTIRDHFESTPEKPPVMHGIQSFVPAIDDISASKEEAPPVTGSRGDFIGMLEFAGFDVTLHERMIPDKANGHAVVFRTTKR